MKLFCTLLALASIASSAAAQQPAAPAKETVVTTYNLSDLVRPAPDYPLPPSVFDPMAGTTRIVLGRSGGGGGGGGTEMTITTDMSIQGVAELVTDLIEPTSWQTKGGDVGQVAIAGGLLIVRHTKETQAQVSELLRDIRNNSAPSRPVRVQATWCSVDDGQPFCAGDTMSPELMANVYARAETTCFSGQTVHVMSNREQTYVADVQPIVGTNAALFDSEMGVTRSGVMLQISPQLVPETNSATINVISIAAESEAVEPPTTNPSGDVRQAQVDRIRRIQHQLQTTIRLPLGEPTIVGGMTLDVGSKEKKTLVLVLQADAVATP